jgi:hypothetical protein
MPAFPVEGPRRFTHQVVERAFRRFRPARLHAFYDALHITAQSRVLDIGGTPYFWNLAAELGLPVPKVTLLNLAPQPPGLPQVLADACRLPFRDQGFDAVFCNSVIEHVGTREAQVQLADEIRRIAPAYFVQTPSRRFPVETHFVTLFLHWFPKPVQKRWMRRLSLAGTEGRLPQAALEPFLDDLFLLNASEFQSLFPEAEITIERFLGLEKSLTAKMAPGSSVPFSPTPPPRPSRGRPTTGTPSSGTAR